MNEKICSLLKAGMSVIIVGKSDTGKTWYAMNSLIPYLREQGLSTSYVDECSNISENITPVDVAIIDEVETFLDREYLEKKHPEEQPYYSKEYEQRVFDWFSKLEKIKSPAVYFISRDEVYIENFIKNIHSVDWDDRQVTAIRF